MVHEKHVGLPGLLQKKSQDGLQTTMEATLMAQQTPAQREQVCQPCLTRMVKFSLSGLG